MSIREYLRNLGFADIYRYLREYYFLFKPKKMTPMGFYFRGNELMSQGRFESDVVSFLKSISAKANVFIDIGAHHGYFSCIAQQLGMKIFSFEPDPINFKILKKNLKSLKVRTSEIKRLGISDHNGKVEFYGFSTGVSLRKNWSMNVSKRKFEALISTLDGELTDVLSKESSLVLKIDVEGNEINVLRGARDILSLKIPIWIICEITFYDSEETNVNNGIDVLKYFTELGFLPFKLVNGTLDVFSLEDARELEFLKTSANIVFQNRFT